MSFSFNAVGTPKEVVAQLGLVSEGTHGTGALGPELAALLAKHLSAPAPRLSADHEYRYVVQANGHSGGGAASSLSVTMTPHYVRRPVPKVEVGQDSK